MLRGSVSGNTYLFFVLFIIQCNEGLRKTAPLLCLLPFFIFVRSGFKTFSLKFHNHTVKSATPHLLKPFGMTKPLNKCRTDCIVGADERSTIPSLSKSIVTITTKCPYLRTIIRTINGSSYMQPPELLPVSILGYLARIIDAISESVFLL